MTAQTVPSDGPFRGARAFDEASGSVFFGREDDLETLLPWLFSEDRTRVSVVTGLPGAGKTSFLRAGLLPALPSQAALGLYVDTHQDFDQEVIQAASRARAEPPQASENTVAYLKRLSKADAGGVILILDHLESALLSDDTKACRALARTLTRLLDKTGDELRIILSVDTSAVSRLGRLLPEAFAPAPQQSLELNLFDEDRTTAVIEQTALQTGTFIESGLAAEMATDLCRGGRCLPLELQIVARTVLALRLTSVNRYRRSGGALALRNAFFERGVREGGKKASVRVLLQLLHAGPQSLDDLESRPGRQRTETERAVLAMAAHGIVTKLQVEAGSSNEKFALAHKALRPYVATYGGVEHAHTTRTREILQRRMRTGGRLSLIELLAVRRYLRALSPDERQLVRKSVRIKLLNASLLALAGCVLVVVMFIDLRNSFSLDYDRVDAPSSARVVVRMGKPRLGLMSLMPHSPAFGSVIADTGFSASDLSADLDARIHTREATGNLGRTSSDRVPNWLNLVLSGLGPVKRGTVLTLLGDPTGIRALQQAFANPATRGDALDLLEIVGQGGAGEDEILAAALNDKDPLVRLRGVEVAASIDRRIGRGAHAATLRKALTDSSKTVRGAVLTACASLPPEEAANILQVAWLAADPAFRAHAEKALLQLAITEPALAAQAAHLAAKSDDAQKRRAAMSLMRRISERAPGQIDETLASLIAQGEAPEDTRVETFQLLRHSQVDLKNIEPHIRAAISSQASPPLRAAALPLFVRLVPLEEGQAIARDEMKGSAQARATAAALWGVLAELDPLGARKALRTALFDPSTPVRTEAARGLGALERDGLALLARALLDPRPEVQRAAMASAIPLAEVNAYRVSEALTKALRLSRPAVWPEIVRTLGTVGRGRARVVLDSLMWAYRRGTRPTRTAVAQALCALVRAAKSPNGSLDNMDGYLRVVARDPEAETQAAAAGCLDDLATKDLRGSLRIIEELVNARATVPRKLAAQALRAVAQQAGALSLPPLAELLQDAAKSVRLLALEALLRAAQAAGNTMTTSAPSAAFNQHRINMEAVLLKRIADGEPDEQIAATKAAAALGSAGPLQRALQSRNTELQIAALQSAAALGPQFLDVVESTTESGQLPVRTEALRLFVALNPNAAPAAVVRFYESVAADQTSSASLAQATSVLGMLDGAEPTAVSLLRKTRLHKSERVRIATADALALIAQRTPELVQSLLEQALGDDTYDVRLAAHRGLAVAWAAAKTPEALANTLRTSERDSRMRFVALEALVYQGQQAHQRKAVATALAPVAADGTALAKLAARIGLALIDTTPNQARSFLARILGT